MKPLERAKLLLAKAQDDEALIDETISFEKVSDEIIGFHAQNFQNHLWKYGPFHHLQLESVRTGSPIACMG